MQLSENGREMRQRETGTTNSQLSTDISSIQADKTGTIASKDNGGEHANKWAVLALFAVGVFMATLDTSLVNISLPPIAPYFGVPFSGAFGWGFFVFCVVLARVSLAPVPFPDLLRRTPIL